MSFTEGKKVGVGYKHLCLTHIFQREAKNEFTHFGKFKNIP